MDVEGPGVVNFNIPFSYKYAGIRKRGKSKKPGICLYVTLTE